MLDLYDQEHTVHLEDLEKRLAEIKVIRPLEIGYETLAEGTSARDFIHYTPVRSIKPHRYTKEDSPRHPLFGDAAVLSREVSGLEFKSHSEFYKQVVEKKYGKGSVRTPVKQEEDQVIPWHLVGEPEHSSSYREYKKQDNLSEKCEEPDSSRILHRFDSQLVEGVDKLKMKIDWLKYYCIDDTDGNSDSDHSTSLGNE